MPLKYNPTALIPWWTHSKHSDCAFSWLQPILHTTLCLNQNSPFIQLSEQRDSFKCKRLGHDHCKWKPWYICPVFLVLKLYANTSKCWLKPVFYWISIWTKLSVCLTTCVCRSSSFTEKSFEAGNTFRPRAYTLQPLPLSRLTLALSTFCHNGLATCVTPS